MSVQVEAGPATEAARIVRRARAAQAVWGPLPPAERAARLAVLPGILGDAVDRIADVVHADNGKPRAEAVLHEAVASVALARHQVAVAARVLDDEPVRMPYLPHRSARTHRRPYGVVVAIAPWNLPFVIPISQVLPALLAGNAVVLKPSELTPGSARLLAELVARCDLPDGVLQVVEGDGSVGRDLVRAQPDKVVFTGSVPTGRAVMAECARHPIPVSLELGGVDAMIVREDADLEFTASAATWGATFNGGQACCSVERLVVHESVAEALVERIADKMRRIDTSRDLGPAVDERQYATWLRHVADARRRGLTFVCGGQALPGNRIAPALVVGEGVGESLLWREETFGPVLPVVTFATDDEAVRLHDASPYGLTASVFTADVGAGRQLAGRLRAGVVSVNDLGATLYGYPELPWGGVGSSGFGRSHGREALLDMTWTQVVEGPRGYAFGPKRPWWYPYGGALERVMGDVGRAFAIDSAPLRVGRLLTAAAGSLPLISRFPKL